MIRITVALRWSSNDFRNAADHYDAASRFSKFYFLPGGAHFFYTVHRGSGERVEGLSLVLLNFRSMPMLASFPIV